MKAEIRLHPPIFRTVRDAISYPGDLIDEQAAIIA
jgi:hypothetical protein